MISFVKFYPEAVFNLYFSSEKNVHIHRFHPETSNSIQSDKTIVLVGFTDLKLNLITFCTKPLMPF